MNTGFAAGVALPADSKPSPARRLADLRNALAPYRAPNTAIALLLLAGDIGIFAVGQALVVFGEALALKLVGTLLSWIGIVRLFLIGHDACHGALTKHDWLNKLTGRIAFLPSLTTFSMWHVGHNVVHHGFNNLRGRDFVWQPLSPEDYLALPRWRQALERVYRSALGPPIYYGYEIWWKRLYFPGLAQLKARRWQFVADCALVTVAAGVWVALLVAGAMVTGTAVWLALVLGFAVPFLLWTWTVGLVVYLHHTAPDIRWFDSKREWLEAAGQATGTRHLTMPAPLNSLLHHIMEHPAHHLDGTIPLYRLKAAQAKLLELLPEITTERFSWAYYKRCLESCKTYDYAASEWRPFPAAS